METVAEARDALAALSRAGFIGPMQRGAIFDGLLGEEKAFFISKVSELSATIEAMPKTYDQDGLGDNAVAHLHYFVGGCDWYITEKDMEFEQLQAFGLADLGYGPELGYIWLGEITSCHAEIDMYWTPKTLREVKAKVAA
jgi:hypothetical protein